MEPTVAPVDKSSKFNFGEPFHTINMVNTQKVMNTKMGIKNNAFLILFFSSLISKTPNLAIRKTMDAKAPAIHGAINQEATI